MRFVYTALAFVLLVLNLAMISSLAGLTPIGVTPGSESSHVVLELNNAALELNHEGRNVTSAAKLIQPKNESVSMETHVKIERSKFADFMDSICKMSMSHTLWILMSVGLVLILAIPDVADLYAKVKRNRK